MMGGGKRLLRVGAIFHCRITGTDEGKHIGGRMMDIHCTKCGREIEKSQVYEYRGKVYCEDCYLDILSPPKACDPWAVHSAKTFLKERDRFSLLTPRQRQIVDYLKAKSESTPEEIMKDVMISEEELRREFAVLRHMEILGATKKEGKIFYKMFEEGHG
jgi:uncharacterized Zn finger protein (UPF0148 family)